MPHIRIYAFAALLLACLAALIFWPDGEIPMGPGGQEVPVLVIPAETAEADSMPEAEVLADQRTEVNTAATGDTTSPFLPSYTGPDALTIQVLSADTKLPVADADVYIIDLEVVSQKQVEEAAERWNTGYYQMLRTYGHHYRCNRDGVVSVPRPKDFPLVLAEKGDSNALRNTPRSGTSKVKLYLRFNRTLAVTVVDASGFPQAGIPVASLMEDSVMRHTNFTLVTDASGRVVFEYVDSLLDSGSKNGIQFVELGFPMAEEMKTEDQRVELSKSVVERGEVTLRLPPMGSVRIRVLDDQNEPYLGPGMITLNERDPAKGYFKNIRISSPLTEGVAEFAHVGLGTHLQAAFKARRSDDEEYTTFAGPTRSGEPIEASLTRAGRIVVTGTLLIPNGRALAEKSALFSSLEKTTLGLSPSIIGSHSDKVQTDSVGRFRYEMPLPSIEGSQSSYTLEIKVELEDEGELSVTVDIPESWPTGEHDLGKLNLRPGKILLAGRVIGPDGEAVGGANIGLAAAGISASGQETWTVAPLLKTQTDADGNFTLLGSPPEAPAYRVQISAGGYESFELEVELGQQDLELVLSKYAVLSGSIRFGGGISDRDVMAFMLLDGEPEYVDLFGSGDPTLATLRFHGKSKIPYAFEVRSMLGETVFRLENVVLQSGTITKPPELQPLDLSALFHTLHIRVENRLGETIDAEILNKSNYGWVKYRSSLDGITLVSLPPFEAIAIQAPGYAGKLLNNPVADQVVVLDDGLKVFLQIPAHFVDYRGFRLSARVYPVQGPERSPLATTHEATEFDANGRADLAIPDPGEYEVYLHASAPDGAPNDPIRLRPIRVSVTEDAQLIDLKIDQEELVGKIEERLDQE
jgi:Carboxypeptidase regulatory-like domain